MSDSRDKDFNETLKRLMEAPPKPHEDMKKGREPQQEKKKDGRNPTKSS